MRHDPLRGHPGEVSMGDIWGEMEMKPWARSNVGPGGGHLELGRERGRKQKDEEGRGRQGF